VTGSDRNYTVTLAPGTLTILAAPLDRATTTVLSTDMPESVYGESVTATATVQGPAATPTGVVQFRVGGVNIGAPVPLGNGQASLALSLPAGSHAITATYTSDDSVRFREQQRLTARPHGKAGAADDHCRRSDDAAGSAVPPLTVRRQWGHCAILDDAAVAATTGGSCRCGDCR
jgi:phage tail sheath gpL-like